MRRPFLWLALASAVLLPQTAYAWGAEGHEIVGLIALKQLDPRVQATVNQMLADNPDHLTAPDIADAANWADKFRDSDRNTTQIRYRLTREWHFVDLELDNPDASAGCSGHPLLPSLLAKDLPTHVFSTKSQLSRASSKVCRPRTSGSPQVHPSLRGRCAPASSRR